MKMTRRALLQSVLVSPLVAAIGTPQVSLTPPIYQDQQYEVVGSVMVERGMRVTLRHVHGSHTLFFQSAGFFLADLNLGETVTLSREFVQDQIDVSNVMIQWHPQYGS